MPIVVASVPGRAAPAPATRAVQPAPSTLSQLQAEEARGLRLQLGDDVALPLPQSLRPSEDEKRARQAAAWFMTGRYRQTTNDFRGAYDAYKRAAQLAPDEIAIYQALIPLAFSLNRTNDAIAFALKAAELDRGNWQLARQLGRYLAAQGKLDQAVQLLQQAARSERLDRRSPGFVLVQRDLGVVQAARGKLKEAAAAYRTVLEAVEHPDQYGLDEKTRAELFKNPASAFERIGEVFLQAGDPQAAIRAFKLAGAESGARAGTLNYNLALVYYQTKEYDLALQELNKYLEAQLQSKGQEAYELLEKILRAQGRADDLVPRLEQLAKADPRNPALQLFLASRYAAAGRTDDALAIYQKILKTAPTFEAYLGLADLYRRLRDVPKL
ncbi:MAG: tetratricopeptide repeat protein, partial [Planctomycetota bacterium]